MFQNMLENQTRQRGTLGDNKYYLHNLAKKYRS